jgi:TonB family protein
MLHPFISSPEIRPRPRRPALVSMALHLMLLSIAVTPVRSAHHPTPPRGVLEKVHYMTLTGPPGEPGHTRATRHPTRAPRSRRARRLPRVPAPPRVGTLDLTFVLSLVSSQAALPDVAMPALVDTLGGDAIAQSPFSSARPGTAGAWGRHDGADSMTYVAANVDRDASPAGVNPKPAYPADLLRRGIETSFSVYFVVDTAGRVDTTSIQFPPSVEPRFLQAVRDVMVRWHFVPAEVRGRRVRQWMEQTFRFKIISGPLALRGGTGSATGSDRPARRA